MSTLTGIIQKMKQVFAGDPWYGKSVTQIIEETDQSTVYNKLNASTHSAIELLYPEAAISQICQNYFYRI